MYTCVGVGRKRRGRGRQNSKKDEKKDVFMCVEEQKEQGEKEGKEREREGIRREIETRVYWETGGE